MTVPFSDQLRQEYDTVWEAQHQHPFVRGLGDGTLDPTCFQIWLRQDFLFLIEYTRLFALAAARAAELDTMKWMISMADGVLNQEMLLHRAYAVELGIPAEDLVSGIKLPTTRAYTDHLLRTASLGSYLELVAAMLPCVWGYTEIATRLMSQTQKPVDGRYRRWVEVYSGPVAVSLARKGRHLLDRLASGAGPLECRAASEAFATSSQYQLAFWEMCCPAATPPGK